jgi:hypothetical protein
VRNWCGGGDDLLIRREGTVAWDATRGFISGTARDVEAVLGWPTQESGNHLEWRYGSARIVFDSAGRVAATHHTGELLWSRSVGGGTLAGLRHGTAAWPQLAENGSYYGEISPDTGRPKTVFVQGYNRSDGTHVRSHYRSAASADLPVTTRATRIGPGVAENGSYYGQISGATGRPKTTHARGYYRRDGTYVRGHYRSR